MDSVEFFGGSTVAGFAVAGVVGIGVALGVAVWVVVVAVGVDIVAGVVAGVGVDIEVDTVVGVDHIHVVGRWVLGHILGVAGAGHVHTLIAVVVEIRTVVVVLVVVVAVLVVVVLVFAVVVLVVVVSVVVVMDKVGKVIAGAGLVDNRRMMNYTCMGGHQVVVVVVVVVGMQAVGTVGMGESRAGMGRWLWGMVWGTGWTDNHIGVAVQKGLATEYHLDHHHEHDGSSLECHLSSKWFEHTPFVVMLAMMV